MLKFIHLTDTHLVKRGELLYQLDPVLRLRAAIDNINVEHADAAFAMITGDLAHWGEPAAYQALREELSRLVLPVHLLIGNHDDRVAFCDSFPETGTLNGAYVQYSFVAGGYRHIALDSNEPGVSWGIFCSERARWLDEQLAADEQLAFLYIHHPPFPVGIAAMDRISLRTSDELRQVVLRHRAKIRHIFFGHLHRPVSGSWMGIPVSTLRGTNHQVALVLGETERVPGSHEPPQYAVVLASADAVVVHAHDFGDRSMRFEL